MNILVIRFRQMGDMILATAMTNALRQAFPDACIDVVLNKRIAPLFEGHGSIDNIITFTDEERHNFRRYLIKVWKTVHAKRYDAIIHKAPVQSHAKRMQTRRAHDGTQLQADTAIAA